MTTMTTIMAMATIMTILTMTSMASMMTILTIVILVTMMTIVTMLTILTMMRIAASIALNDESWVTQSVPYIGIKLLWQLKDHPVYLRHVCFRIIQIFFQIRKFLTPTLKNIQNPESCKTLVTRSWAGAAPGALEAVGRSPSVQRESALAAPRSRESERTFWGWLDHLRIGVDYPGGDHLGRVSGAGLSVRDVSRSRLSLVLRSLVRKSTWQRPPILSRKRTKNYRVSQKKHYNKNFDLWTLSDRFLPSDDPHTLQTPNKHYFVF